MIYKKKDPRILDVVSKILPKEVLYLNPMIAGGSAVSIYMLLELYNSPYHWQLYKNSTLDKFGKSSLRNEFFLSKLTDIDLWFEEGHEIFKTLAGDLDIKITNSRIGFEHNLGPLKRTSYWANTYGAWGASQPYEVQIIKKPVKDFDDLFSTFDFLNCCVGIQGDTFYFAEGFEEAYYEFRLTQNRELSNDVYNKRLYTVLRGFKYCDRYALNFDEKYTSEVFQLYLETVDHPITIKYFSNRPQHERDNVVLIKEEKDKLDDSINYAELASDSQYLNLNNAKVDIVKNMISQFLARFRTFADMKHFKMEQLLYFVNSQVPTIDSIVEEKVDKKTVVKEVEADEFLF
jgi:hypothetical protein